MKFDTGSMATRQISGWKVSSSQTATSRGGMSAARAARSSCACPTTASCTWTFTAYWLP
jgi:hypothetical protein